MTNEEMEELKGLAASMGLYDDKNPCKRAVILGKAIKALEQQKTGHWILTIEDWNKWTCSECGYTKRTDIHVRLGYDYCPRCGSKMEGVSYS